MIRVTDTQGRTHLVNRLLIVRISPPETWEELEGAKARIVFPEGAGINLVTKQSADEIEALIRIEEGAR